MSWTAARIRKLRLCLGWSRNDLARRMQCTVEAIETWESGGDYPSFEQSRHLDLLERHRDSAQEHVQRAPKVESYLDGNQKDQVLLEDIEH